MILTLTNPHATYAAIESRPEDILEIVVSAQVEKGSPWALVKEFAESKNIRVGLEGGGASSNRGGSSYRPGRKKKSHGGGPKSGNQEGGRAGTQWAKVRPREEADLRDVLGNKPESGYGTWLILDCLQDPQNIGAIFRSAAFFGIRGIVMTRDRSAPMTETVYDVACGGVEWVPFCIETNLRQAIDVAKDMDLWTLGTSEHADKSFMDLERDRNWLLVIGNEEKGIRKATWEACDEICTIPQIGGVGSLNASVASAVLMSKFTC